MSNRAIKLVENEYYHIYNRGNSKQKIFLDTSDSVRFQDLLYLANTAESISIRDARRVGVYEMQQDNPLVAIGAYCLMQNHFHILLTPLVENGASEFMRKVSTGYAMYFNKKYNRRGTLYEGKFKSQHAAEDRYLKYLFSYIHLNPLKLKHLDWRERVHKSAALLKDARTYAFSSYQDYIHDTRNQSMILAKEHFPEYFNDVELLESEMLDWIQYQEE